MCKEKIKEVIYTKKMSRRDEKFLFEKIGIESVSLTLNFAQLF
jgi:hypothetical protein